MSETLQVLAGIANGYVVGDPTIVIDDVVHDHRDGATGSLFVARRGLTVDGHRFVLDAASVCSAVCVSREMGPVAVPQLVVPDTSMALGTLAAAVHGHPFDRLRAVGVTGTNGKTMVTHLIGAIVAATGGVPAVAGTLGWFVGDEDHPLARTSPEASDLHRMAAGMVSAGADIAAFEVSSHALSLGRVAGASFAVVAFTNLTEDHLDFHPDMESYFAAKASLFQPALAEHGIVWVDDPYGHRLAELSGVEITTVGTDGDVAVSQVEPSLTGTAFTLTTTNGSRRVTLGVPGSFNVANAAVAAACAIHLGLPLDAVVAGLEGAPPVRGRFERVAPHLPFAVVVDYAHTPDGVVHAIEAARALTPRRVLVVLGAGGDRDHSKRPAMGRAAASADVAVITTDNPRSEDPTAIAQEVTAGIDGGRTIVELDRRKAIRLALEEAQPGDIVLILGKGHEEGQEFADRIEPFSDAAVVAEEAAAL